MNGKARISMLLSATIAFSSASPAEPLQADKNHGAQKILQKQMDNKATFKLASGEELTGTIKAVYKDVTHLNAIAGEEYNDAVIVNEDIAAVIMRVTDN